jgi:6-phosphogluconolactonase
LVRNVASEGGGDISLFTIDSSFGALTQISGSPFGAGSTPVFAVVDASDEFLYVGEQAAKIYGFSINASTGALGNTDGSPYSVSSTPSAMVTVQ